MKFCYNTSFTFPKQSQKSRSILDGSRFIGLFWRNKLCLITEEIKLPKQAENLGPSYLDLTDFFRRENVSVSKPKSITLFLWLQVMFFLPKHSKILDPSYKMDLDIRDCLGRVKLIL